MSGGVAFVYDTKGEFEQRCNLAMVALEPVLSGVEQELRVPRAHWHRVAREEQPATDEAILRQLLEAHFRHTGSFRAKEILADWSHARDRFVKVMPHEYKRALAEAAKCSAVSQAVETASA
jgi:glutamate synthase (NADPH/NADH) large chain